MKGIVNGNAAYSTLGAYYHRCVSKGRLSSLPDADSRKGAMQPQSR